MILTSLSPCIHPCKFTFRPAAATSQLFLGRERHRFNHTGQLGWVFPSPVHWSTHWVPFGHYAKQPPTPVLPVPSPSHSSHSHISIKDRVIFSYLKAAIQLHFSETNHVLQVRLLVSIA